MSILIVQESCPTAPLSWRRRSIHVSIERRGAPRSNRTQSLAGGPRLARVACPEPKRSKEVHQMRFEIPSDAVV